MSQELQKQPTKEELQKLAEEFAEKYEEAVEKSSTLVSSAVHTLLKRHAFIGHLVQMLNREHTLKVPTAAVGATKSRFVLYVNPFFYSNLKPEETHAVMKHEIFHLINDHLNRRKERDPYLWNVAADLAINPFIENLPRFDHAKAVQNLVKNYGLTEEEATKRLPKPDSKGQFCDCLMPSEYGLPNNQTAEWYYNEIMNNPSLKDKFQKPVKHIQIGGDGQSTNMTPEEQEQLKDDIKKGRCRITFSEGDHKEWESLSGQTEQILDEELKRMIQQAKDQAPKSFGTLPGNMQQAILEFLTAKVNWKAKFRSWLQRATKVLRSQTRKRPSRRFGITYPGQKSDVKLNLGVIVDSSGSIHDEDLKLFGGEINRIWETKIADVHILVGDTKINDDYPMRKKMRPEDFKVSGRGGTDANSWIRYAEKHHAFDAVVILTDGEFWGEMKRSKIPVLWALTSRGMSLEQFRGSVKFGKMIKLDTED